MRFAEHAIMSGGAVSILCALQSAPNLIKFSAIKNRRCLIDKLRAEPCQEEN